MGPNSRLTDSESGGLPMRYAVHLVSYILHSVEVIKSYKGTRQVVWNSSAIMSTNLNCDMKRGLQNGT